MVAGVCVVFGASHVRAQSAVTNAPPPLRNAGTQIGALTMSRIPEGLCRLGDASKHRLGMSKSAVFRWGHNPVDDPPIGALDSHRLASDLWPVAILGRDPAPLIPDKDPRPEPPKRRFSDSAGGEQWRHAEGYRRGWQGRLSNSVVTAAPRVPRCGEWRCGTSTPPGARAIGRG